MAKKVREKPKGGHKDKQGNSTSPKTVSEHGNSTSQTTNNGVSHLTDRGLCIHVEKGLNADKISAKIGNSGSLRCEACKGHIADTRSKKGQGKHGKKRGKNSKSGSKAIWVCLECGHFGCGDLGLSATPQSHAVRHASQSHHPLVVHYENHHLLWCFLCDKIVPEDSKLKEGLEEVSKMLKRKPGEGPNVDVEDFIVSSVVKSGDCEIIVPGVSMVYSIRGLLNLGNTCFFNSIMQNLSAIDSLREYLFKLDESVGPLIASLRNFFLEIRSEDGLKSAIDPRSLFGNLCTKAPQFRGYQQHDSHELLRCLLDSLSIEELSAMKPNGSSQASIVGPTFVDAIFGGQLSSTVRCLECGHSSTIYEPFLDLSLPVPMRELPGRKIQPFARGKKPKVPPKKSGKNHSKMKRKKSNIIAQSTDDKKAYENVGEQSASLDGFAWLDFLGPPSISGGNDVDTETDETSAIHGFANEKDVQTDALLSATMDSKDDYESNVATGFSATSEHFNTPGPGSSFTCEDKQNENLQSSECLFTEGVVRNDSVMGHGSESRSQEVFAKDKNTLEMGSENTLDFIGLADLFRELEVPSDQPLSEANSNNGVIGNINVSDPDEVDDADAPVSVESCLSLFTKPELLLKDEHAWECDNCSTEANAGLSLNNQDMDFEMLRVKRDATKTMLIRKVPSVLTIQLKRFSQDSRGRLSKLNAHVNFKETIDLKPYMDPRCVGEEMFGYRLVGLVEHLGSMRGGHYVAYVRGGGGKKCGDCIWYHASDAHVRRASLEEVTRSQAYILFYQRT